MASSTDPTNLMLLLFTIFSSIHYLCVFSFEYKVGGSSGWVVPPVNDTNFYNDWASENRFQIGDSLRFKYKNDSVVKVNEEEYKKCNSSHPTLFSNTGNTVYKVDHAGPFYFISGVSEHCKKGQRIIIKVMAHEEDYPSHSHGDAAKKSDAAASPALCFRQFSKLAFLRLFILFVCFNY